NGAGKSTLIKILSGIHTMDSGTVIYENSEVVFRNPRHAQEIGIATVHQELNLASAL
ncbi:MAG TPA: D-xylose ABC transporter ATP-binding protein, partial [Firmicutes bacterium]|nr:D-xylose ABC transporter ATP-binding protein [Bacillota bacterium]